MKKAQGYCSLRRMLFFLINVAFVAESVVLKLFIASGRVSQPVSHPYPTRIPRVSHPPMSPINGMRGGIGVGILWMKLRHTSS